MKCMQAAANGDVETLQRILSAKEDRGESCVTGNQDVVDAACYDASTGKTALMSAAESGSLECVSLLLQHGAVWNAQCRRGLTAGEYALNAEEYVVAEAILDHAVRCELILGTIERQQKEMSQEGGSDSSIRNDLYLKGNVKYHDGENGSDLRLVDDNQDGVMMGYVHMYRKRPR